MKVTLFKSLLLCVITSIVMTKLDAQTTRRTWMDRRPTTTRFGSPERTYTQTTTSPAPQVFRGSYQAPRRGFLYPAASRPVGTTISNTYASRPIGVETSYKPVALPTLPARTYESPLIMRQKEAISARKLEPVKSWATSETSAELPAAPIRPAVEPVSQEYYAKTVPARAVVDVELPDLRQQSQLRKHQMEKQRMFASQDYDDVIDESWSSQDDEVLDESIWTSQDEEEFEEVI